MIMKKIKVLFLSALFLMNVIEVVSAMEIADEREWRFLEFINTAENISQIAKTIETYPEYRPGAGTIYLHEGQNTIRIETDAADGAPSHDSTVRVKNITLSSECETIQISGKDYDTSKSYGINSNYGTADFSEFGYVTYNFDVSSAGLYTAEIDMAVNKDYSVPVYVYVNGILASQKNHQTSEFFDGKSTTNGYMIFITANLEKEDIFYPEEIYGYLINRDFLTLEDYYVALSKKYASKLEKPDISLCSGGKEISKPQSESMQVKLAPVIKAGVTVVVAVYNKNMLAGLDLALSDGANEMILELPHVESDEPTVKIFFFDSLEKVFFTDFYEASKMSIYVSEDGSDVTGNGTKHYPFKSLEKAKEYANTIKEDVDSDIVVNIKSGDYFIDEPIEFTTQDSGVGENSIIYKGESQENIPLISGGVKVSHEWEEHENGIYKVLVPDIDEARAMYINGYNAQRAVSDTIYVASSEYDDPDTSYETDGFILSGTSLLDLERPQDLEMVTHISWVTQRVPVKDIELKTGYTIVKMEQPYYDSYVSAIIGGGTQPKPGCIFYLENALEFLDEPGEFYFNPESHELYYYPFENENLAEANVYLPKSEGMINITGDSENGNVKNLKFKNLDLRHGAYNELSEKGYCSFQADCMIPYDMHGTHPNIVGPTTKSQVSLTKAEGVFFEGCRFVNLGSAAIGMHESVRDVIVKENVISDVSGTGIIVGSWRYNTSSNTDTLCNNITIENNVIRRAGQELMGCVGIGIYYAKNISVLNNDILDLPYTGITLGWGWGSEVPKILSCGGHKIVGNRIENVMLERVDGGHIYMLGDLNNTLISDNYLINSDDLGGIYLDSGTENVTVTKNVFKDCSKWLFINTTAGNGAVAENNYVEEDNHSVASGNESDYKVTDTIVYENGNWAGESLEITENAGLADEVSESIIYPEEIPSWRTNVYDYIPRTEKALADEYLIEAEDFLPGGNNMGYYAISGSPTIFNTEKGRVVIGGFRPGEWFNYSVDVSRAGTYNLEIRCSTGPNAASTLPKVSIYVGEEEQISEAELYDILMSWDVFLSMDIGTIRLEEGTNIIKIKNMNRTWTYDNFKLSLNE